MIFESLLLNISVLLVLIVALTFDYATKFFSYWYVRHIPYKRPIPFFGSDIHKVLAIRNTSDEVNQLCSKNQTEKFVGYIKSRIPDLILKDPEAVSKMLSTDRAYFHNRGLDLDKSKDVCLRNNLFYAEGEKWTLLRTAYESLINNLEVKMENALQECLSGTNGDENIQQLLTKLLDIVFEGLLLGNNDTLLIKDLRSAFQNRSLGDKVKSYLKNIFPSLYVILGLKTLPDQLSKENKDVLLKSKLMTITKESGSTFQFNIKEKNQRYFKKESETNFAYSMLLSFISEGYIPLQYLLTSLLFEVAKDTEVQKKARNSQNDDEYLNKIIKETLRLHPPYSVITRKCIKTYQYPDRNLLIDRGVTLTVPVEYLQKDRQFYEDPEIFNPDRLESSTGGLYLPFGFGPRKCIGENLSMQIAREITKVLLQNFQIEPTSRTPERLSVTDHNFGRIIDQDLWLRFVPLK